MARGPEKNGRKRKLIIGAGALAVAGLVGSAMHGEKTDVSTEKLKSIERKAERDAGVEQLRDGFGKVIAFAVQADAGNKPMDKPDSGPNNEERSSNTPHSPNLKDMNLLQLVALARAGNLEAVKEVFFNTHNNIALKWRDLGVSPEEFTLYSRAFMTAQALERIDEDENSDRSNDFEGSEIVSAYDNLLSTLDQYMRKDSGPYAIAYNDPYDPAFLKLLGLTESQLKDKIKSVLAFVEKYPDATHGLWNDRQMADFKKRYGIE